MNSTVSGAVNWTLGSKFPQASKYTTAMEPAIAPKQCLSWWYRAMSINLGQITFGLVCCSVTTVIFINDLCPVTTNMILCALKTNIILTGH